MMWRLLAAALLCGCTPLPDALRSCPPRPPVPAAPPAIRTPGQLGHFAVALELAREAERRRGDACAEIVRRLVERIEQDAALSR